MNHPDQANKTSPPPIDHDLDGFATGTHSDPASKLPSSPRKTNQRGWAGCIALGCVSLVVVGVVGMIAAGVLLRVLYREVLAYSEDQPQPLPRVEPLPEPLVRSLKSDYETFKRRLESSLPPPSSGPSQRPESKPPTPIPNPPSSPPIAQASPGADPPVEPAPADLQSQPPARWEPDLLELRLNADQINTLIQDHPDFRELRDRIVVFIEQDHLHCQFSVPISWIGIRLEEERYLNGEARIAVALKDGRLKLDVHDVRIKGRTLPTNLLNRLRRLDFNAQIETQSDGKRLLRSLESIEIRDGFLILRLAAPAEP